MADVVTEKFVPGFRLIDGTELNNFADQVNAAFDGSTRVDALDVTGNVVSGGYVSQSVGAGLTAAGNNRATALAIADAINQISTAAASTGVVLPALATPGIGSSIVIFNAGANNIKVYAAGSETIDGTAGATGVTLTAGARCQYIPVTSTAWISALLGAVSA